MVETVAAELLSEEAEWRGQLSEGQFESRTGWSSNDAAAIMVDRAHAAWTNAHITGVLLCKYAYASVRLHKDMVAHVDSSDYICRRVDV